MFKQLAILAIVAVLGLGASTVWAQCGCASGTAAFAPGYTTYYAPNAAYHAPTPQVTYYAPASPYVSYYAPVAPAYTSYYAAPTYSTYYAAPYANYYYAPRWRAWRGW